MEMINHCLNCSLPICSTRQRECAYQQPKRAKRKGYFAYRYQQNRDKMLEQIKANQKKKQPWKNTDRREYFKTRYRAKCDERRSTAGT